MSVFVSAIIKCKAGYAADLKPFLLDLVKDSRNEKACLQYDLHQSINDENIFVIYEEWVEQFWFDLHRRQEHVDNFKKFSRELVEQKIIIQSERIV